MLRRVSFFVLFATLAACSGKKEKVINLSDRIPKSERNYDEVDSTDLDSNSNPNLKIFQDLDSMILSVRKIEERAFIDRFRPKSSEKFTLFYANPADSIHYMKWGFADTSKTKSAFFNWMDDNNVSYFGAEEKILKEPFTLVYSDTMILIISGNLNLKSWRSIIEAKELIKENDYLIEQRKYGKAKWYQREEKELKLLKE